MPFEEKGSFILSASIHFVILLAAAVYVIAQPEEKPEEMIFELMADPGPVAAEATPPAIEYQPEETALPTLDEIELPEPEPLPVETIPEEVMLEPEPQPEIEAKPEKKPVNFEDFSKRNPIKRQRLPKRDPSRDLEKEIDRLTENVSKLQNVNLPTTRIDAMSSSDQDLLASYFSRLRQSVASSVQKHALGVSRLQTKVRFTLAPNGRISGVEIVSSSGDPVYDRKVLEGFRRVPNLGAPPGLHSSETLELTVLQADR